MLILCDLLYAVPFVASDGEISSTETRPSKKAVKKNISFIDKYGCISCELWKDNTKVSDLLVGGKDYRDGYSSITMNFPFIGEAIIIRRIVK